MDRFRHIIEIIGVAIDSAGVLGALIATGRFLIQRAKAPGEGYRLYRQDLGRAILLGLEFLIAGDIIRTGIVPAKASRSAVLGSRHGFASRFSRPRFCCGPLRLSGIESRHASTLG